MDLHQNLIDSVRASFRYAPLFNRTSLSQLDAAERETVLEAAIDCEGVKDATVDVLVDLVIPTLTDPAQVAASEEFMMRLRFLAKRLGSADDRAEFAQKLGELVVARITAELTERVDTVIADEALQGRRVA